MARTSEVSIDRPRRRVSGRGLLIVLGGIFLFVLVFAWNEYLLAVFLSASDTRTMPLTVVAQDATRGPQWWFMSVLVLIMIGPVIVMAILLPIFELNELVK